MKIIEYQAKYKQSFIELNLAWLNKFFTVEVQDSDMLSGVEELIKKAAAVYFAIENDIAIATCMIIPRKEDVWEICKLATDECYQGKGAGTALMKACMDYAIVHGAKKIMLVSNRILTSAMHLYARMGFREVPIDFMEYERVNIQMEYIVPTL